MPQPNCAVMLLLSSFLIKSGHGLVYVQYSQYSFYTVVFPRLQAADSKQ